MAALDHSQGQLAKDLIDQVVKALVAENGLLRDDSNRIRRLTGDAATTLRRNFRELDELFRQISEETGTDYSSKYQAAYSEIVSTLQFEDIVSQVVGHQLERSEITMTILMQIEEQLRATESEENYESMLTRMSKEIETYLTRLSASDSVKQQTLVVGETELF